MANQIKHISEYTGDRATTVCFTGHRPEGIPFDISDGDNYRFLLNAIYSRVYEQYLLGMRTFITGMAYGVDLMAGEAVMMLKERYSDVKLICAIPQIDPAAKDPLVSSDPLYRKVVSRAEAAYYCFEKYTRNQYDVRNRFMVDNSAVLIAVLSDSKGKGGSYNTYKYALKQGVTAVKLELDALNEELRQPADIEDGEAYL